MFTTMSPNVIPYPVPRDSGEEFTKDIFHIAEAYGMEDVRFKVDPATGIKAIVAIHSTRRGSALGGTRCLYYPTAHHGLEDAIRLARGMSYKSAFAGLPYGGGKGVLLRPKNIKDRDAYFECYGQFIGSLNGRFITAVDVGTKVSDMDIISRKTKYVLSTSADTGDPLPAYGQRRFKRHQGDRQGKAGPKRSGRHSGRHSGDRQGRLPSGPAAAYQRRKSSGKRHRSFSGTAVC